MTRFIPPLVIGAATGGADALGRALQDLPVSLGTTATVSIFCGSLVLWLMTQFNKRDQATTANKDLLIERHQELSERLARIEQKLEDLPCKEKDRPCPPAKPKA